MVRLNRTTQTNKYSINSVFLTSPSGFGELLLFQTFFLIYFEVRLTRGSRNLLQLASSMIITYKISTEIKFSQVFLWFVLKADNLPGT